MTLAVPIVFFLVLLSPTMALYGLRRRQRRERQRRLIRRLESPGARRPGAPPQTQMRERGWRMAERLGAIPLAGAYLDETARRANTTVLLAMPALFAAGSALCARWLSLPAALLCGLALAAMPLVYLRLLHRRWLAALSEQMPYLVDLLRSALESGHTTLRALQMAAHNLPEPLADELRVIVEQVQLGMTVPLALEAMYERAPTEELGFLVAAVRIQSDVGNSLAEVFQHVSESMRGRQRAEQQLRALTAQSRASAVIVTLLPFVVLAALSLINPAYSHPLFHNEAGVLMLKLAIVLDVAAFFAMRRIARVDY